MNERNKITRSGRWVINVLKVIILGAVIYSHTSNAEAFCFRTSDCDEGYSCHAVQGSAMGLCKLVRDRDAERRAEDTENFNPYLERGGQSVYRYVNTNDNYNDNENDNASEGE